MLEVIKHTSGAYHTVDSRFREHAEPLWQSIQFDLFQGACDDYRVTN